MEGKKQEQKSNSKGKRREHRSQGLKRIGPLARNQISFDYTGCMAVKQKSVCAGLGCGLR